MLRIVRLTDDAYYDAGDASGNSLADAIQGQPVTEIDRTGILDRQIIADVAPPIEHTVANLPTEMGVARAQRLVINDLTNNQGCLLPDLTLPDISTTKTAVMSATGLRGKSAMDDGGKARTEMNKHRSVENERPLSNCLVSKLFKGNIVLMEYVRLSRESCMISWLLFHIYIYIYIYIYY
ncbi:unnamed protein product [Protopolystoma xenopodis]|uniref:Uncharacterized protein n=1 Tax=Protopolystoma xenopodis TaxID=117903 RepID=A0A448XPT2_9PLAT|nr:unnamed protein product [Protopolystoma xenopodis]